MAKIIDAHHHLWSYNDTDYGWISKAQEVLRRDFLMGDLAIEAQSTGVEASVAVQARQSVEETRFLLECASETPSIVGVVGWVPLADAGLTGVLHSLRDQPKLKGVRHVVQDEPDEHFLLQDNFNRGIASLVDTGLAYDILIHEHQLSQAVLFARLHPQQRFVLDHLAKPKIATGEMNPWRSNLMRLADCPNVSCKMSGLVTEADLVTWTYNDLQPYMNTALDAFGADRLMAGSDWPVCLLASTYERWWSTLLQWSHKLSPGEQEAFLGGNAIRFYRLDVWD